MRARGQGARSRLRNTQTSVRCRLLFLPEGGETVQTVAEMIPDYKQNLDALRARRRELIAERELEPSFERRHALTVRIIRLDGIIASTTAALHDMIAYAD